MIEDALGRQKIVEYLKNQMLGPTHGESEVIRYDPLWQYTCGILYPPRAPKEEKIESDFDTDDEEFNSTDLENYAEDDELGSDEPIIADNLMMPSSFGLTFSSTSTEIEVLVGAAIYEKSGAGRHSTWNRLPLQRESVRISDSQTTVQVFDGRAQVLCRWRPVRNGSRTLTIAISRMTTGPIKETESRVDAEQCLFQVSLEVRNVDGKFVETPPRPGAAGGPDEARLELQYRDRKTYARGHACAAEWDVIEGDVAKIRASHIPVREVFPTIPRTSDDDLCRISELSFEPQKTVEKLGIFIKGYEEWILDVQNQVSLLDSRFDRAAQSIVHDLTKALGRMHEGLEVLKQRSDVLEVFTLANRAMLHQMAQSSVSDVGSMIEFDSDTLRAANFSWRPFQLAFSLVVLPSLINPKHHDRSVVDMIWFQTGGGKTEAYLLISAIEILWQRMKAQQRERGTVVLMRYTLRLLTAQQFERVSRMICALEILRIHNAHRFDSDERFSAGLWVGGDVTPNNFAQVDKKLESGDVEGAFGLRRCPWCSTLLDNEKSFSRTNRKFIIRCVNKECEFSGENSIPVDVVDQSMYLNPPTLIVGTVDKFAQMAWNTEVRSFLVGPSSPPSLIIQDELHLLGGPLGSIYGLYEAAIDVLTSSTGFLPKVIASTATIRDADKQVRALYGRNVEIFPPAGISIDDSYFARTTTEGSRLYVGVLSANKTATTSIIRTSAVLAQAPLELKDNLTPEELDAYWTQIIYHTSLKEEGRTFSFLGDDIPVRIGEIASDKNNVRELESDTIEELTSSVDSRRIPLILDRLGVPQSDSRGAPLSAVTCTNMLSVGVDVPRLGLMVVHGQPKSTSEYIQATSRIGRKISYPGLVVAHYRTLNPRDLSHFELFTSYHDAFYRFVEPASVTPHSLPCRQRALHAGLISVIRHSLNGRYSSNARVDFTHQEVRDLVEKFKERLFARAIEQNVIDEVSKHVDKLVDEWSERTKSEPNLVYQKSVNSESPLMIRFDEASGRGRHNPWRTLTSMRSVDVDVKVKVEGRR